MTAPVLSISEIIVQQVEAVMGRPLTDLEKNAVISYNKDAAQLLERRIAMTVNETVTRLKHDSRL